MRTKFVQTLADYQLELKGLRTRYEFDKAKPVEETDDEEFIDVTGDDSTELQPKVIPNLEQPPSKIYYDNIEKESSDGGFFDRDDLEDEDEKNDLIIDCKLNNNNGETGEKKTESETCGKSGEKTKTATAEPELVFNFTVVDTQLVYNEPTSIGSKLSKEQSLRCGVSDRPVVSISIPPPSKASPVPQKQSLLAAKLKEVRIHPYGRTSRARRVVEYPSHLAIPVPSSGFHRIQHTNEPIGSRARPSAFSPPAKAHVVPQSVQLKPSVRLSTRPVILPSDQEPLPPMVRKPPKKLYRQLTQAPQQVPYLPMNQYSPFHPPLDKHQQLNHPPLPPEFLKSPRYLPPQFGFGSSVLQNLYDPEQPLDFSKNSLLCQYENMLKCSQQQQIRQGHTILRSMPLPLPPSPPKTAYRPKVVPLKQHPTLYQVNRSAIRPPNETFKPVPKPPTPNPNLEPPTITSTFLEHMNFEIEAFFTRRQAAICDALRLFASEAISLQDLFRRLDNFQIRFGRDYDALALTMMERYGYRFRKGADPRRLGYRFKEQPQSFAEYFGNLKDALRPHLPEETLNIYRLVVGSLLEQFRGALEHFLSRNLH